MDSSMVYKLYACLEKNETREFVRWLNMWYPQSNKHGWLLKKMDNRTDRQTVKRAMIQDELFANVKDEKKAESELTRISKEIKFQLSDFLAFKALKKQKNSKNIFLMKEIQARAEPDVFHTFWKNINRKYVGSKARKNADFFRTKYELEVIFHEYLRENQKDKNKERFENISSYFNCWWAHEQFIHSLAYSTSNMLRRSDLQENQILKEECIRMLSVHYEDSSFMQQILQTMESNQLVPLNPFQLFKDFASDTMVIKYMDNDLLKNLFNYIYNYFASNIHTTGNSDMMNKLAEVYAWGIDNKLVFNQGQILINHYDNILVVFRQAGRLSEALFFTEELAKYLPNHIQKEAYAFNYGQYLFYHDELLAAKKVLSESNFSKVHYNIQSRFTLFQINYELLDENDKDYLINYLNTLYEYVRYQPGISDHYRKVNLNRIRLCRKLMEAYYPNVK